ncbi:MAG: hypothetical protein ACREN3_09295, partial [Gemmatimonadaceae bacterium]
MIEHVCVSASLAPMRLIIQDVGVSAQRARRRFTAAYKLKILQDVERCRAPGEIGARQDARSGFVAARGR